MILQRISFIIEETFILANIFPFPDEPNTSLVLGNGFLNLVLAYVLFELWLANSSGSDLIQAFLLWKKEFLVMSTKGKYNIFKIFIMFIQKWYFCNLKF